MTGTAITHRSDVPVSLSDKQELAKILAHSGMLPKHLHGNPANLLLTMYAADAYGIPLFTAFDVMHVIDGKVGFKVDFMRARLLDAGHTFRVVEATDTSATVVGIRSDDPDRFEHRASYTLDDAKRAELTTKSNYRKHGPDMLVARATGRLMRQAFSDVMFGSGAYTPDEIDEQIGEEPTFVRVVPQHQADGGEIVDAVVVEDSIAGLAAEFGAVAE